MQRPLFQKREKRLRKEIVESSDDEDFETPSPKKAREEDEESDVETANEKKERLARQYLEELKQQSKGSEFLLFGCYTKA